jgi:F-type H+-transporting ATPase subunit gamma
MAQLKEIRSRITSVQNTRQVTNAMKLVSAAKLKKAQDAIISIAKYDEKLHDIIKNLNLTDIEEKSEYYCRRQEQKKILIVLVGAGRGLCGPFNSNIAKFGIVHALDNYKIMFNSGNVCFLPIGTQVEKQLRMHNLDIYETAHEMVNNQDFNLLSGFANKLIDLFLNDEFQRIDIVYNKFKNAALQLLSVEHFLPIPKPDIDTEITHKPIYIFEPSEKEILTEIIPMSLCTRLHRIILDSSASEHGARMTAMHQATDNATSLIKELKKNYNNARQSAITNEIIEISAGAEALNKHQ